MRRGRRGATLPTDVVSDLASALFSCSPLGGNSAWRPRSRIPSREEAASEIEKEHERHEHITASSDTHDGATRADRVLIFDTTLRDGEQSPGISLNKQEKLEIAHQLARLGVDVIEAGFPITSPGDFESVQAIAREVEGPVICGLARTQQAGHRRGLERGQGLRAPAHPHVHRHQRHPHRAQAADHARGRQGPGARGGRAGARVHRRRRVLAEDGSRSDVEYMAEVIQIALDEGATHDQRARHRRLHDAAASTRRCSTRALPARAGPARRRRLGALPRRPRPGGRQLAGRRAKPAAARSSARSTASASAPATRRSRRS